MIVEARGHPNVTAKHPSTFEITRESDIGVSATCVVGVGSAVGARHLPRSFKSYLRNGGTVRVVLVAGDVRDEVVGRGDPRMSFDDPVSMVFRRSDYVDGRTVLVGCDKGAGDLSRELVERLRRGAPLRVELSPVGNSLFKS